MTGFSVEPKGSNASTFDGCRANSCTTYGVAVTDSNNTSLIMCQIEGCGTGIHVTATSNALSDATIAVACRFEGNGVAWEAANNFVRDMTVVYPAAFTPYRVIDNGSRTQHWGTGSYVTQKAQSQLQSATGSWRFERIIDGGAQFPALVVSDTATGAGIPVTIQAETEQPGGYAFRAIRAGLTYWDVDASGNMRFPEGGYIELSKREGDPEIPLPNTARLYLRDDGGGRAQLCARFASGAVQVISTEP
jgi:parallel beta-helix repeat protein